MKVTIIGHDPIFIDDKRGESLQKALVSGQEYVSIDGELFKSSVITSVTKDKYVKIGGVYEGNNPSLSLSQSVGDGNGLKKYLEMRNRLRI